MIARLIVLTALVLSAVCAPARVITLPEAIDLARQGSVDAAVAANRLRTAYWEYRSYRADLLPEVKLQATVPSYNKRYSAYQREDGSYTFLHDDNVMLNAALNVEQRIWLTGGTLSLTSSLDFVRQLGDNADSRFMTVPVALRLNQPLFGVNDVKWSRRIEPVRYKEACAEYVSSTEEVALQAITYYFDLLIARDTRESARQNVENAEKMYEAAKIKRSMGRISENDLLQIELNLLNSRSDLTAGESRVRSCMFRLSSFLGLEDEEELVPQTPPLAFYSDIDYEAALEKALEGNPLMHSIRRRQLQADYDLARARGATHEVNLFAQVGLTGTDDNINAAYRHTRANQVVEIGVSVPLLDWGRRKGKVQTARSQAALVREQVRKEQQDFRQSLFVLVEQINNQRGQLDLADRADLIAGRRYSTSVEAYLIGKISALDLNDSQESKDSARNRYLTELFRYWYYYYQLRSITLWDFADNTSIDADFRSVIFGR